MLFVGILLPNLVAIFWCLYNLLLSSAPSSLPIHLFLLSSLVLVRMIGALLLVCTRIICCASLLWSSLLHCHMNSTLELKTSMPSLESILGLGFWQASNCYFGESCYSDFPQFQSSQWLFENPVWIMVYDCSPSITFSLSPFHYLVDFVLLVCLVVFLCNERLSCISGDNVAIS